MRVRLDFDAAPTSDAGTATSPARSRVRYVVGDARAARFDVSEDFSVTDRMTGGSVAQRAARRTHIFTAIQFATGIKSAELGSKADRVV